MTGLTATAADPTPAEHGEGPVWDAARGELLWVDITAGLVRRGRVAGDGTVAELAAHRGGDTVGVVVPAADGGWLLGAGGGFTHLSPEGEARVLLELSAEGGSTEAGGTRMNDGACDRAGRFYAGTMAFDERAGAGTLYRVDLDGTVSVALPGLTISNGLGWSPDDRTAYLSDSGDSVVWAFDYDLETGALTGRREFLRFDGSTGVADGLVVDDEGCVWTAMWGGRAVRRWSPDGELLTVVDVPTENATSCCFAGPERDVLVISTSAHGLDYAARTAQPGAGRLFTARPGVSGPAAYPYRGPLTGLREA
ncbi:SMP-30/gluconolactonase/LRE family protein [Modestobacter sp. SYSU DS0290]